ncbi:MAG: helix-turn-helix domain-containing protein [Bacilli bacterium]
MKDLQTRLAVTLKIVRVAGGKSQEEVASALYRDQAFASRVEAAKTVITPDIVAEWVSICGGRRLIDAVIRQLQAIRSLLDYWGPDLLQA